ncbi:MAG: hypothetical protein WAL15_13620 [Xanthobacteraceae bacterium]
MAELAVVDEIDAGLLLAADEIDHGIFELSLEGGFVDLLAVDMLMVEFDDFRRARQAAGMGRQDPVRHVFSSDKPCGGRRFCAFGRTACGC